MKYLLLAMSLFSTAVLAEETRYDQVNISASASEQVAQDMMTVELYIQYEGERVAPLAEKLNIQMGKAIAIAKKVSSVSARTGKYSTTPIYNKRKIDGWRIRQSLHLESQDFAAMQQLLSQLQPSTNIASMGFKVSDALAEKTRSRLIDTAIGNFKQRAEQVSKAFSKSSYRIVNVSVNTLGDQYRAPPIMQRSQVAADAAMAAPAVVSGKQKVAVSVGGTIELSLD